MREETDLNSSTSDYILIQKVHVGLMCVQDCIYIYILSFLQVMRDIMHTLHNIEAFYTKGNTDL